jgi:hypothetical protein
MRPFESHIKSFLFIYELLHENITIPDTSGTIKVLSYWSVVDEKARILCSDKIIYIFRMYALW